MSSLHQLIRSQGVATAKTLVDSKERPLIDLAAAVMAAENPGLSLCYSGFAVTALPHKALDPGEKWERKGHNMRLIVSPGSMVDEGGVSKVHGIPYGAMARMILLYLQTQAIRTDSPEVTLGRSMSDWLGRMGLSVGGKTVKAMRQQALLISTCHLQFIYTPPNGMTRVINDAIVREAIILPSGTTQPSLWDDKVRLSDTFFQALKDHPVPLAETAIREICNDSSAIDVYIWLAYRLHSLAGPTPVTWEGLRGQFGAGYACVRTFRRRFRDTLAKALAVYPDAQVSVDDDGVILYPSRPPVLPRAIGG